MPPIFFDGCLTISAIERQIIRAIDMAATPLTGYMETSCGLVLLNYDTILLLQYPQGHWDFVKGHLEESDGSHEATALRELEEETGISNAAIAPGFKMRTKYEFTHKGKLIKKQVHWFLAETDELTIKLSHEHIGYLWLSWEDAASQLTFENSRSVLAAAREFHSS
jgi:8-oxo-dGTP pyrophosphatase MutT (NUDIX family)